MIAYELPMDQPSTQQSGLEALRWVSDVLEKAGIKGRLERVDIAKSGAVEILLTVGKDRKWLAIGAEAPKELNAWTDEQIPFAGHQSHGGTHYGLTVLTYRPARRLVVRDARGSDTMVIKAYRKGRGAEAARKFGLAAEALVGSRLIVPGPVRFNPLHDSLTMPFLPGTPPQIATTHADDFRLLGQGIRDLQGFRMEEDALAEFTRMDELAVLDELARKLRLVSGTLPADWERLRQRLEQDHEHVPTVAAAAAHRDLHDGQFLLTLAGPALLDFDLMCRAEPELDPANFLAHLTLRCLQHRERISEYDVAACGKQFLDGLNAYERNGFWQRLRFYQASSFCRLALVYSFRPHWTDTVPALVRMGHRCLDDLQRLMP